MSRTSTSEPKAAPDLPPAKWGEHGGRTRQRKADRSFPAILCIILLCPGGAQGQWDQSPSAKSLRTSNLSEFSDKAIARSFNFNIASHCSASIQISLLRINSKRRAAVLREPAPPTGEVDQVCLSVISRRGLPCPLHGVVYHPTLVSCILSSYVA
jgi:hypothetical protein